MIEAELFNQMSATNTESLLTFRVNTTYFCTHAGTVSSIIEPPDITPIPLSPSYLKGLILYQGEPVPVFCLRTYLNEPVPRNKEGVIIITGNQSGLIGVWVDEANTIIDITNDDLIDSKMYLSDICVKYFVQTKEQLLLYIELDLALFGNTGTHFLESALNGNDNKYDKRPNSSIESPDQNDSQKANELSAGKHIAPVSIVETDNTKSTILSENLKDQKNNEPIKDNKKKESDSKINDHTQPDKVINPVLPLAETTKNVKASEILNISNVSTTTKSEPGKFDQPHSNGNTENTLHTPETTTPDKASLNTKISNPSSATDNNIEKEPETPESVNQLVRKNKPDPQQKPSPDTRSNIHSIAAGIALLFFAILLFWYSPTEEQRETLVLKNKTSPAENIHTDNVRTSSQINSLTARKFNPDSNTTPRSEKLSVFDGTATEIDQKKKDSIPQQGGSNISTVDSVTNKANTTGGKSVSKNNRNKNNSASQQDLSESDIKPASLDNMRSARKNLNKSDIILDFKTESYSIVIQRPLERTGKNAASRQLTSKNQAKLTLPNNDKVLLQTTQIDNPVQQSTRTSSSQNIAPDKVEKKSDIGQLSIANATVSIQETTLEKDMSSPMSTSQPDEATLTETASKLDKLNTGTYEEFIYVVAKGDTLWDIAARYLGDPFKYKLLSELSHVRDPDWIYPGDIVTIRKFSRR